MMEKGDIQGIVDTTELEANLEDIKIIVPCSSDSEVPDSKSKDECDTPGMEKKKAHNICSWGDCQETCDMKCGACQKVAYCCAEHQKKHWKKHRNDCCPYIIKQDEELGTILVAARDLKVNVEIIREGPAIYSAVYQKLYSNEDQGEDSENDFQFCLTCCTQMKELRACSKCGWPVCELECETNSSHSHYECDYLTKAEIPYPVTDKNSFDAYKSIFILRLLLFREQNPTEWDNLIRLYYVSPSSADESSVKDSEVDNFTELINSYGVGHLVKNSDDLKLLLDFICYLTVGETRTISHGEGKGEYIWSAVFLYEKLLMLGNNNCYPNACWGITVPPSFEIVIRSAVPIKKGTPISIPLNNEYDFHATYMRQIHRLKGRRNPCKCVRCCDPTELQTNISSVKCFQCKKGYYSPVDPISIDSDWRCCYCEEVVECHKIFDTVTAAQKSVDEALSELNMDTMENIHSRLMKSVFHPHHFVLLGLSYTILQMHVQHIFDLNEFGLERVVSHCRHILSVADIVLPGLSMIRATVLTALSKATCLQIRNITAEYGTNTDKGLLANRLTKLQQSVWEALEYYKSDPNTTLPSGENYYVEELETIKGHLYRVMHKFGFSNYVD